MAVTEGLHYANSSVSIVIAEERLHQRYTVTASQRHNVTVSKRIPASRKSLLQETPARHALPTRHPDAATCQGGGCCFPTTGAAKAGKNSSLAERSASHPVTPLDACCLIPSPLTPHPATRHPLHTASAKPHA
ncbi:hypothetical protein E2C01_043202 [Portunus trituberculatus]|uniref:Uncharacterized protein n=1 Tax=Portunus trituberculatus TaxID=210409 RepID=A0A5B7FWN4_PORTR|nr:hypothetical protein [Portunus trituberculatus]